ncbi:MAG: 2-phosphosulfolactate phosphatase [Chitinophagaceae bacterium]|nr:2-phosphosulfolactate phosphatase [Chitinophagaceae bacterium]
MNTSKPTLYTCLSPSLLHLYEVQDAIVVVIDVFRATSTIAAALYNGAEKIIPVDSVSGAIELGQELGAITAGERDGKIAPGLQHGNSPLEYPRSFVEGKTLVLTTTNGTRLLHMALRNGATEVITGSFANLSAVCNHLIASGRNVILGCAAWKDRVNMEDSLFAGAVVARVREHFQIFCDASLAAETLYRHTQVDTWNFIKKTTHYHRLASYGLEKDMEWCISVDVANVLPVYKEGALVVHS